MYTGTPFIIITDNKFNEFQTRFAKDLLQLKQLNILYRDPVQAAKFINNNYDKIANWWHTVSKNKNFLSFKRTLFLEKKNYLSSITKTLTRI